MASNLNLLPGSDSDLNSSEQTKGERKKHKEHHFWDDEKRLSFLRIIDLFRPFNAKFGTVTSSWIKVAAEYNKTIQKSNALSAKSAKLAYDEFLSAHRKDNKKSLAQSGIDEDYTEEMELLQNLDQLDKDAHAKNEEKHKQVFENLVFNLKKTHVANN